MPHGVVEWRKSDRDDLHDNPYSCSIYTFAKDHISHQGVVRLIAVRESDRERYVDDIVCPWEGFNKRLLNRRKA
jgi:hypothetical protein